MSVIGALLFAALFTAQIVQHSATLPHVLLLGVACAMAAIGAVMFPTRRYSRPIVDRRLLLGASLALVGGAVLLLLNGLDCQALLSAVFHSPVGLGGLMLAWAPVALTEEQIREFKSVLDGLAEYKHLMPKLKDAPEKIARLIEENTKLHSDISKLRRSGLAGGSGSGVRWIGEKAFVSDDCAKAITSIFVVGCAGIPNALEHYIAEPGTRQRVLSAACGTLGVETRTAMTGTEIPLPTVYVPQVVELVYKYGQARQYATVFPLGAGTVKLPRLKAGEDDFGYFGAGTAGMSQPVTEKRVTAELVTFTANKAGGLIRLPFELEEDTFIPIGQFLARYIARQLAKLEDKTLFLADGTNTYASQTGVGAYCVANPTYLLQLQAGKTKPSDATLADFRNLRSKVSASILAGGFDAAYYLSPTFEPFLRSFNQYPNFVVFENVNGKPMFDGWPVRWIGVSQSFQTTAAASSYLSFFGDLSYWYLGERGNPRIEVSRDVFFATDEIAMRALERIDVEAMAIDAMATLATAAA